MVVLTVHVIIIFVFQKLVAEFFETPSSPSVQADLLDNGGHLGVTETFLPSQSPPWGTGTILIFFSSFLKTFSFALPTKLHGSFLALGRSWKSSDNVQ